MRRVQRRYGDELVQEGLQSWPEAAVGIEQLEVGGLYRINDWSVCLLSTDDEYVFKSIEQHFELGHIFFNLTAVHIHECCVALDNIFTDPEAARASLNQPEVWMRGLSDSDSDSGSDSGSCDHSYSHDLDLCGECCDDENYQYQNKPAGSGKETLDVEYWDELFSQDRDQDTDTEWVLSWTSVQPQLKPLLAKSAKYLVIGCGNSDFSASLYDHGYRSVTSMDVSPVVIDHMREKHRHRQGMQWDVEDVMQMRYPSDSFDIVLDKSLLDCMFHVDAYQASIAKMLPELMRVLTPTGYLLIITERGPDETMPLFRQLGVHVCLLRILAPSIGGEACKDGTLLVEVDDPAAEQPCECHHKRFCFYSLSERSLPVLANWNRIH